MKKLIIISIFSLFIFSCEKDPFDLDNLFYNPYHETYSLPLPEGKKSKYTGPVFSRWKNGKMKSEGKLIDGRRTGMWYEYNFDETITDKIYYSKRKKGEDYSTMWVDYGIRNYHKTGIFEKIYFLNSNIISREVYKDSIISTHPRYFINGGELGRVHIGESISYYKGTNQIRMIGDFNKDGKKDGEWTWYKENGQIRKKETYKDGKLIETK